jgi:hypothetical protein
MANLVRRLNRDPQQRSTAYGEVSDERIKAGQAQGELLEIINTPAEKIRTQNPGISVDPKSGTGAQKACRPVGRGS